MLKHALGLHQAAFALLDGQKPPLLTQYAPVRGQRCGGRIAAGVYAQHGPHARLLTKLPSTPLTNGTASGVE